MLYQSAQNLQLAQQHLADLHAEASRERLAKRAAKPSRARTYAGLMLIALGARVAPAEIRGTNGVRKFAA